ncbi:energy-coupling factor transporter ATPase [Numidum massiliense]|uniref:energy-coupling factor transporter ATPase n=1 Tax=Numidum massiliense TaxID=1522315 RepID=UPI0006D58315|nr:energy-coupling factor transporter ATPase [Numidum massiliense]
MQIVAENLGHTYGVGTPFERRALHEVSFHIPSGSFTGVIGRTGSGKSTLIQHFNGLLRPTHGKLTVGETVLTREAKKLSALRRDVGMVFQYPEHQLFEETVASDVAFGPQNLKLPAEEVEQRVRTALEKVGLPYDDVATKSPFELSGGQMRRVAIAGVLAMRPRVLVLDEPTAGLDPQGKREIMQTIVALQQSWQLTVVFVSHNMAEVARYADQLLVLSKGTVALQGPTADVFAEECQLQALGLDTPPELKWLREVNRFIRPSLPEGLYTPEQLAEEIAKRWRAKELAR